MNNLFYREKENWLLWLLWGISGAGLMYIIAHFLQSELYNLMGITVVIAMLTWQIYGNVGYSFKRTFKITFFVFTWCSVPLLFYDNVDTGLFGDDVLLKIGIALIFGALICTISSFIAKSPKQYY